MNPQTLCYCCQTWPPDKDMKTSYLFLGKVENYADMLKNCFEITITQEVREEGICDTCISRLRDACEFKDQVIQCQISLQHCLKEESSATIKKELPDLMEDHSPEYLLDDGFSDEEDNKKLIELLQINSVLEHKSKAKNGIKKSTRIKKEKLESAVSDGQCMSISTKHRVNVSNLLRYSNCTPFYNKSLNGIICAYCKHVCDTTEKLRTHNEIHKNDDICLSKRQDKSNLSLKLDITDLKCNLCNVRQVNISDLKKHLKREHEIKFYPDTYDYVLEFKLTEDAVMNCALCNSTFETFKMLLQHMNGHYRNFICDSCDMGFINMHKLKNHQRTHEIGAFKCTYCDKIFTTRAKKKCHEKYTHNSTARYTTTCPQCDQCFNNYYQRNRHMFKEHNTVAASYKCNVCDKSFILKSKLTSHIKKVHLMERNHTCPVCGQGFFIKQSLDEHMVKHSGERSFECTVCHKSYARKKTLREHMRIHNNDRRFKCTLCGSAFVQKCSLKSHMLSIHSISLNEFETAHMDLCNKETITSPKSMVF